jgi:16S rRNA processing protein RimM
VSSGSSASQHTGEPVNAGADGRRPERLEVGRVVRPHGIRGEVIVRLVTNRTERLAPGSVLDTDDRSLQVVRAQAHRDCFVVTFIGISSREMAETLRGRLLRATPIEDPEVLWVDQLIGAEAVDRSGRSLGRIETVEANPASDLLVLVGGAMVPLRFVLERREGLVVVDPPPGLLD